MNYEEKKRLLEGYRRLNTQIDALLEEKAEWLARATSLAPRESDGSQHFGISDTVRRAVEKLDMLEREIDCKIDKLVDMREEIIGSIEEIPDELQRQIIYLRYVRGRAIPDIAAETGYCERQVMRLCKRAVESMNIAG